MVCKSKTNPPLAKLAFPLNRGANREASEFIRKEQRP